MDLFCLRVLGYLVCRGSPKEKAGLLSCLISKNVSKWKQEEKYDADLYWDDYRLKRSARLMLYFAIVLPVKFLTAYKGDALF